MNPMRSLLLISIVFALPVNAAVAQTEIKSIPLGGTSWQLLEFVGGDDTVIKAPDPSKYTVTFVPDGSVSTRVDCNVGHGTWKSPGPNQLQMAPMALTRAMCLNDPIGDRFARDWEHITGYVIRNGHLFLTLKLDSGHYEFAVAPGSPVLSSGPENYHCSHGAEKATFALTHYQTQPDLLLVKRDTETHAAFRVLSADGTKYQGQDVTFFNKGDEALLTWAGNEYKCTKTESH